MLVTQHLSTVASQGGLRPAYRYLGKETHYNELKAAVARLSYLYQHDLGHGARVAFVARNSPALITSFFALANTRTISIILNPEAPPEEILAGIRETKATHIAVTSDLVAKVRDMLMSERLHLPILDIEKKHGGEYATSYSPPPDNAPVENDPILCLRTEGTTGKPKFAVFTHKQVHHAAIALRATYHSTIADRFYTQMGWHHPFALVHGMLLPILTGGTCVIDHGLEGSELFKFLIEARVTRVVGTPSFFYKLLLACRAEKRGLAGVRSITVGRGSLSMELTKAFALLKIAVSHCYGQAENTWSLAMQEITDDGVSEFGRGLPGVKYKVLDSAGDEIPGKDVREGQLAVMGPTVMTGYLEREKETRLALRGTWLHTGDVARLTGDGESLRIQYLGRTEDVVRAEGKYVQFSEINLVLRKITGVQDAAVFAGRNPAGEQWVACAIVKVQASPLTEKQFLEHASAAMPAGVVPRFVVFVDSIPRDGTGGVNQARLRAQYGSLAG